MSEENYTDTIDTRERPEAGRDNGGSQQGSGGQPGDEARAEQAEAEKIPAFLDPATEQGLAELVEKLAPLIQGGRLHNIVDLMSLLSDTVDLSDAAMIEKLAANYEQAMGGAWAAGNAARYAANEVTQSPTPSMFGLMRATNDEDVRRGLYFMLRFFSVLGRQMRPD